LIVSSISQSRNYRTSRPANQFSTYLSPAERAEQRRKEQADALAKAMDKNFTREWKKGDIYAPHDLSAAEARKWRKKYTPTIDAFDALSLNPLDFYKVQLFHFKTDYES
jgi:small subunit ribosomal protein S18